MSKFIIIPSKNDEKIHKNLLDVLNFYHMIHSVLIYEINHEVQFKTPTLTAENSTQIFSKNLTNFNLKVVIAYNPPWNVFTGDSIICENCFFIDILKQFLKIKIHPIELASNIEDAVEWTNVLKSDVFKMKSDMEIYLHIQRFVDIQDSAPRLMTYNMEGTCFSITVPPKIPIYEQILTRPFEKRIWILLAVAIGCCAIVWRFYKGQGAVDSHWRFIFWSVASFLGQSVKLKA